MRYPIPTAVLALLAAAACAPASAQVPTPEPPTPAAFIEVSGSAQVQVTPDRATIVFAVETDAATAAEAGQQNADRMTRVLEAVRGSGAPGLRVESFGYDLQPVYRYDEPDRRPRVDGYQVRNHVRAILQDPQGVGRIIDLAVGAGANRVASLSFEASDTQEARLEALRNAVGKARAEAETIATAMGARLGEPLEVRGGAAAPPPYQPVFRGAMVAMEAATTPIEAGMQTVSADVSIRYRILPR